MKNARNIDTIIDNILLIAFYLTMLSLKIYFPYLLLNLPIVENIIQQEICNNLTKINQIISPIYYLLT